jgi:DNA-binding SARP family transcriptional activator
VALALLRRPLEPPGVPARSVLIVEGRERVGLNPHAVRVDSSEFQDLICRAKRCEATDHARAALLEEAIQTYGGPLLPGLYAPWVLAERDRLAEAYRNTLRQLAVLCERAGNAEQALDLAHRAVAADAWDEEARADLIRLLAAADRREAALAQYAAWERLLQTETGESPDPALRALAEQIKQPRPLRSARGGRLAAPPGGATPGTRGDGRGQATPAAPPPTARRLFHRRCRSGLRAFSGARPRWRRWRGSWPLATATTRGLLP